MKKLTFSFLIISNFLFFTEHGISQSPVYQIGGRAIGFAGSTVTVRDVWSQYHNQAGLSYLKGINLGFSYQNEFLVKELSVKSLSLALPTKSGVFGLNYYYFGYPKYNENKVGFAFGKSLGKKIAVGIQLDYLYTHIDGEYGNKGIASGELGILSEPIDNLWIGAHLNNVWHTKRTSSGNEYLPTIFNIGSSYLLEKKALLSIEFEKDLDLPPVFKTGVELELLEKFFLRAGISSAPNIFSFGMSYSFSSLTIDLGFKKHPVLGYSQGISVVYSFKDRT
jgi:hypothetical protein